VVEITSSVPASGAVLPFRFPSDPAHGIDYPSVVVLLSPEEWTQVEAGKLDLPNGWNLGNEEDV